MSIIFLGILILNYAFVVTSFQPYLDTEIDYASSPVDMKNLIVLECHIVFELLKISDNCGTASFCPLNRLELQDYIDDFQLTLLNDVDIEIDLFKSLFNRSIIDVEGLGSDAVKHPFKIYRSLRRMVKMLPTLMNSTTRKTDEVQEIKNLMTDYKFPKDSDLETSIFNVLRLNQIFKLSFLDFLKGKVGRMQTKCGLTSEHLVEMGRLASSNFMYAQAVDAFAIALWNVVKQQHERKAGVNNKDKNTAPISMVDPSHTVGNVSSTEIFELLNEAIKKHDEKIQGNIEFEDIQPDSGPLLFNDLLHNISHPNFKYRTPAKLETVLPIANYEEDDPRLQVIKYGYKFEQLCRGEELRTPAQKASLKCYYSSKSHPVFILSPLKIEVHNLDPLLLQFHNVFSENEMEMYRNEVTGELRASRTIRAVENATSLVSRHRTSSNAWIEDFFHPRVFKDLLHKIGRIVHVHTFRPTGSENMQIAAYSPGGHYVPHTDAIFEEEVKVTLDPTEFLRGDRIITFMLYLSDVEEGGGTAFPLLNHFVPPEKGSAMMWYNLHPDGSIDRRTLHGGCSVVYGLLTSG
ncbi:prolyl 4-hydroxylase subunit alpha-1 isoform X2 [Folsomia candida]|uniref:prolyl 4-hydroxylase subunit alpha-1 isoform X2 n=1 Tax=Folsomia candida TaxID=158441 RepID=UPI001604E5DA|nr:prolyl 4-hydroxylase subunit alpha-1 isoform X2 [Folsomia candida]